MFTGIIQELGEITEIKKQKEHSTFTINTKTILQDKKIGQSIAINGACITITEMKDKTFKFDAIPETLKLTNLGHLEVGNTVNMEAALTMNQSLDGHLVQGHVDCMAEVASLEKSEKKATLKIKYPQQIQKHLALKGSITVNGVSLTIADLDRKLFAVELIPHTLVETNLGELKTGNQVNLEIDVISRYLESHLNAKEGHTKYQYLVERGFI